MPMTTAREPARSAAKTDAAEPLESTNQQVTDIEGSAQETREQEALERLLSLPGLGPRSVERACKTLGSAQAVLHAIAEGDLESLTRIPGISPRTARRLIDHTAGSDPGAFFGTPRARRLFEEFQKSLLERACTRAGRNKLRLLGPLNDPQERSKRTAWCQQAAQEAASLDLQEVRRLLRRIERLPAPKESFEADVLLLFDDPERMQAAREAGLHKWAPLAHLRESHLMERIEEASLVVHATDDPSSRPWKLEQADHLVTLPGTLDPVRLAPWGTIEKFRQAEEILEASAQLSTLRGNDSPAQKALQSLREQEPQKRPRSSSAVEERAQVILEEELQEAETSLERLTITGNELMRALKQEVPQGITRVYEEAKERATRRLQEETGIPVEAYTDDVPPRVDPRAIAVTTREAAHQAAKDERMREQALAKRLAALIQAIDQEIEDHEELDARQAVGSLWNDHAFTVPETGTGLLVEQMRPLHLGKEGEGVDYRVGTDGSGGPDEIRVALLSGANSGGKTTLLESITLLVTLAHCGLGVPAKRAVVPELDAVHLYVPVRDRSVGALESLLLDLFPLTQDEGRRLILADELEAITELEAACEILAALLEGLIGQGALAVIATHLAPQLLPSLDEQARGRTRIDGIEAHGLDEQGRLLVKRSPRLDHLARSTPELILRRLADHGPEALAPDFRKLADRVRSRLERDAEE